ncbi:sugar transferase, partial [Nostoc sp. CHAB 5834]|nr:sugar transferase [Nostoc sp. CHAB 5834]
LFKRVLPKMKGFRKLFRLLNVPVDVSKTEIMGRLIYKGFSLVNTYESSQRTVLIAKRNPTGDPSQHKPLPSEGLLFRMERMGQYATPIYVYKFRSMHPYAEYVQAYVHDKNGLDKGGKFKNDFRISSAGRLMRKYWLDELPMVYNLLKGDLKLVGVRPISQHYFSLYPAHIQALRLKQKPGLLPPFYADMPQSFDEVTQSELNYLNAYEQAPLKTDLHYLKRILTNIIVKRARSN